jgi:hypothetical protein
MNIMEYFRTTNKGIYQKSELPATLDLSRNYFGMSLAV